MWIYSTIFPSHFLLNFLPFSFLPFSLTSLNFQTKLLLNLKNLKDLNKKINEICRQKVRTVNLMQNYASCNKHFPVILQVDDHFMPDMYSFPINGIGCPESRLMEWRTLRINFLEIDLDLKLANIHIFCLSSHGTCYN